MKTLADKKTKGFTLVELLVFMAIGSLIIVFLLSIIISFLKSREQARKLSLLQDTTVYLFNDLTQEVHWSEAAPETGDQLTLLQTRVNADNPEAEPDILEVNFQIADGRLLKTVTVNGEAQDPITFSPPEIEVTGFTTANIAEGEIPCLTIQLELAYQDSQPKLITDQQTTISLRKQKLEFLEE